MNEKTLDKNQKQICEICGEEMKENKFAYDYDSKNKLIFKCPVCGHRKIKAL